MHDPSIMSHRNNIPFKVEFTSLCVPCSHMTGRDVLQLRNIPRAPAFLNHGFLAFVDSRKHFPGMQYVHPYTPKHILVKFSW